MCGPTHPQRAHTWQRFVVFTPYGGADESSSEDESLSDDDDDDSSSGDDDDDSEDDDDDDDDDDDGDDDGSTDDENLSSTDSSNDDEDEDAVGSKDARAAHDAEVAQKPIVVRQLPPSLPTRPQPRPPHSWSRGTCCALTLRCALRQTAAAMRIQAVRAATYTVV